MAVPSDSFVTIAGLRKVFGSAPVVHGFDLAIAKGEFVSFLGPSGCGKTTILRMVAGLEDVTAGTVAINGIDVTHLPSRARKIGIVFQSYALFPNMSVADNIGFGPKVAAWQAKARADRIAEMLALIKLEPLAQRFPYQLSGGQQQRVALARALAVQPQVLLLDEPLSALDAQIRLSLREDIRALQRKLGITTIFVTHDQEEALAISDRIVVLNEGRAEQVGTPAMIYNQPQTPFVAAFIGQLNVLTGIVADVVAGIVTLDGQKFATSGSLGRFPVGAAVRVALRPEVLVLGHGTAGTNHLDAVVEDVSLLGAILRIKLKVGANLLVLDQFNTPRANPPKPGTAVVISFMPQDVLLMDAAAR